MAQRQMIDGEEFDKTSLRAGKNVGYGYAVHRDYAAHFFRWSFAQRYIGHGVRMLDLGCGPDTPLVKAITYRQSRPELYVGVDLNGLARAPQRQWAEWRGSFDVTRRYPELLKEFGRFDLIVSFEAIEHMPVTAGARFLKAAHALLSDDGTFLLSTPVFNGKAAKNHIHEYTIDELGTAIKKARLEVDRRYGTFASYHDVKKVCSASDRAALEALREYYDGEVAACFLAPKYPDAARNNLWVLRRKEARDENVGGDHAGGGVARRRSDELRDSAGRGRKGTPRT